MFKLRRPCVNCPFRIGQGPLFGFPRLRLKQIAAAPAFQCHKTVDYSGDEPDHGEHPQQCAGLMAILNRDGCPNQIMQVGQRLGHLDPHKLDPDREAYHSLRTAIRAHTKAVEEKPELSTPQQDQRGFQK